MHTNPSHIRDANRLILRCALFVAVATASTAALAQAREVKCLGNTETGDRQVVQAGVEYLMSYTVQGKQGKARIAGRELEVVVDYGKTWKGPWLKAIGSLNYLSFLPEDGGTIKLKLDQKLWFSGNCR
jgi:hypothetical protein